MALGELAFKGELWIDLVIKKLKMVVTTTGASKIDNKEMIANIAKQLCDDYVEDRLIRSGLQLKERRFINVTAETLIEENDVAESVGGGGACLRPERVSVAARKALGSFSHSGSSCSGASSETRKRKVGFNLRGHHDTQGRRYPPPNKNDPKDLSRVLIAVGEVLEARHAGVYTDVFTQLNITLISEITLKRAFNGVAKNMFADGVSWAKIVSLFAFTGAMASECVLNGANTYVARLKNWTVQFIENELSDWILLQDGWGGLVESFIKHQRPLLPIVLLTTLSLLVLFAACLIKTLFKSGEER